jgi:hypothetical protein
MNGPESVGLPTIGAAEAVPQLQWRVLIAIMETVVPVICREGEEGEVTISTAAISNQRYEDPIKTILKDPSDDLLSYLAEDVVHSQTFQSILKRVLYFMPRDQRTQLYSVLYLMR